MNVIKGKIILVFLMVTVFQGVLLWAQAAGHRENEDVLAFTLEAFLLVP